MTDIPSRDTLAELSDDELRETINEMADLDGSPYIALVLAEVANRTLGESDTTDE